MNIRTLLEQASPVMPVLTLDDPDAALLLGRTLLDAGMDVIEITLRTPAALDCIKALRQSLPELTVGAGTVLTPALMRAVNDAGGQFAVSPGFSVKLVEAARECDMPFLPGVVTASEVQTAMEQGYDTLKFFPASAVGGAPLLSGYASVFPDVCFCPTGGISIGNMDQYLQLPNVACVGGSWVAPKRLVSAADWDAIGNLARQAITARPNAG